jgi:hypothetical protein
MSEKSRTPRTTNLGLPGYKKGIVQNTKANRAPNLMAAMFLPGNSSGKKCEMGT